MALVEILAGINSGVNVTEFEQQFEGLLEQDPDSTVQALLSVSQSDEADHAVRQLSLVLFRRFLYNQALPELSFWGRVTPETRSAAMAMLLELLTTWPGEESAEMRNLRLKVVDAVTGIVKGNMAAMIDTAEANLLPQELPSADTYWPELLPTLWQLFQTNSAIHMESALKILSGAPGMFGVSVQQYAEPMKDLLSTSFASESQAVQVAATVAYSRFLNFLTIEVAGYFADLLGNAVQLAPHTLEQPTQCILVLESLIELADNYPKFFKQQLAEIVEVMHQIASYEEADEDIRKLAFEVLVSLAESKPGMMRKLDGFAASIFTLGMNMLCQMEEDDEWTQQDSTEEESDNELAHTAELGFDRLALALGGNSLLPPAFAALPTLLESPNWNERYAACVCISAIAEGCAPVLKGHLSELVQAVVPRLTDEIVRVRFAACNAIGQLCLDFAPGPDVTYAESFQATFHEVVIPALLECFSSSVDHPRVAAHALSATNNFCDHCRKETIAPYLDPVLTAVGQGLESSFIIVLEAAVCLCSTVAEAAKDKFLDYYDTCMPAMMQILREYVSDELKALRAKTFECVTLMGLSVGKEKFKADGQEIMQLMLSTGAATMQTADANASFIMSSFTRMAQVLKEDFHPYVDQVVPPLLEAAALPPDLIALDDDEDTTDLPDGVQAWELLCVDDQRVAVKTSALEDKRTACEMLGVYWKEMGSIFAQLVPSVLELMTKLLKFYFEDGIRMAAADIMPAFLRSYKENAELGLPAALELWSGIAGPLVIAIKDEFDFGVLSAQLVAFGECLQVLGAESMNESVAEALVEIIKETLADYIERIVERIEARTTDEDYDQETELALTEDEKEEHYLLATLSELVHRACEAGGEAFGPYFSEFVPELTQLLSEHSTIEDKIIAIHMFCDAAQYMPTTVTTIAEHFIPTVDSGLMHENPNMRQACAYAIGYLAMNESGNFAEFCHNHAATLVGLIQHEESRLPANISATENAISAYVRIARFPANGVSEDEMLPQLLGWLPLTHDDEEANAVNDYLCDLLEAQDERIMSPEALTIIGQSFLQSITEGIVSSKTKSGARALTVLNQLLAMEGVAETLHAFIASDPQVEEAVAKAINASAV
eukprot:m.355304 g.355304  ORF g.355304 m.355304 type:complete len:1120 (+) comp17218_c0_seq1:309-3668(+)